MRIALVALLILAMVGCSTFGGGKAKVRDRTWYENGQKESDHRYTFTQGEWVGINGEGGENTGKFRLDVTDESQWVLDIGGTQTGLVGSRLDPDLARAIGDALEQGIAGLSRGAIDGILSGFL